MTLQEFKQMAYEAMIENKMPANTYFYCQAMIWHRSPSDYDINNKPEYHVCFYLDNANNASSDGRTPKEAIDKAVLVYRHSIAEPKHLEL